MTHTIKINKIETGDLYELIRKSKDIVDELFSWRVALLYLSQQYMLLNLLQFLYNNTAATWKFLHLLSALTLLFLLRNLLLLKLRWQLSQVGWEILRLLNFCSDGIYKHIFYRDLFRKYIKKNKSFLSYSSDSYDPLLIIYTLTAKVTCIFLNLRLRFKMQGK